MSAAIVAVIVVVVVLVVAAAVLFPQTGGPARRARLRRRYGPEYDRLAERGDSRAAERELAERERARREVELRQLGEPEQAQLRRAWSSIQEHFVDDPRDAARQADRVIGRVLAELGYPDGDADRQLALASVDHPRAVFQYRKAHELADSADTEALRRALLGFRGFFDELVGAQRVAPAAASPALAPRR
jgi:hypothetical protein